MITNNTIVRLLPLKPQNAKASGTLNQSTSPNWPIYGAVLMVILFIAGGCRDEGFERLPVSPAKGSITHKGKAIGGAMVVFHPKPGSHELALPARATVNEDGSFELTTYEAKDGAAAGDYLVTVEWRRLVNRGGEFVTGPNVLPAKYANPQSTDLEVTIAEGENQLTAIDLK